MYHWPPELADAPQAFSTLFKSFCSLVEVYSAPAIIPVPRLLIQHTPQKALTLFETVSNSSQRWSFTDNTSLPVPFLFIRSGSHCLFTWLSAPRCRDQQCELICPILHRVKSYAWHTVGSRKILIWVGTVFQVRMTYPLFRICAYIWTLPGEPCFCFGYCYFTCLHLSVDCKASLQSF